ncbi:MAG: S1C family serine protease [Actinomycetota bacterium]|nr:S1C family serine protease [Actinomycetota bacterium]
MSIATAPRRGHSVSPPLALAATALLGVVALAIALAVTGGFGQRTALGGQAAGAQTGQGLNAAGLYAHANPGVVDITAHTTASVPGPFGLPQKSAATQTGTGLVLDKKGHVLTANHVVVGTRSVTVTFQGGATRTAKVLGRDVLDAGGRVIGIADQIDTGNSGSNSSTGVGFAVPVDIVKSELSTLDSGATPAHAYLGVAAADATNRAGDTGALVQSVQAGYPAARAGVRPGDLIVAIGRAKVVGDNDVIAAIANLKPGDRTTIKVIRNGKNMSLTATLTKQPTRAVTG